VEALLRRAAQTDADEDRRYGTDTRGDELPDALAHREGRLQKIREAQAALEAEAQEQARAEGKNPREAEPQDTAQRNFTDPESRIQKQGRTYLQGYNAQVAVDAEAQVIVAQHVTAEAPDVRQLLPLVQRIPQLLRRKPRQVLADAG
jgi:DDE family transposase